MCVRSRVCRVSPGRRDATGNLSATSRVGRKSRACSRNTHFLVFGAGERPASESSHATRSQRNLIQLRARRLGVALATRSRVLLLLLVFARATPTRNGPSPGARQPAGRATRLARADDSRRRRWLIVVGLESERELDDMVINLPARARRRSQPASACRNNRQHGEAVDGVQPPPQPPN